MGYIFQGKFSEIIQLQKPDPFFKRIMFDLPHKQLSWLMRACVDVLPSFANLRRWNKVLSNKCALCPESETTHHVLNCCNVALKQKRFNLRHDSILLHIVQQWKASNPNSTKRIYADVEGYKLPNGGTLPPEIIPTALRPDLVLVDSTTGDVELFDLTSCADRETNINNARKLKRTRYAPLVADIDATGRQASFEPFEVCALGNIRTDSKATLSSLVGRKTSKKMFKSLAKIAISCSYFIIR